MAGEARAARGALRAMFHPAAIALAALTVAAGFVTPLLALPGAIAWVGALYFLGRRGATSSRGSSIDMTELPPTIQRDVFEVRTALTDIRTAADSASRDQQIMLADVLREAADVEQAIGACTTTSPLPCRTRQIPTGSE